MTTAPEQPAAPETTDDSSAAPAGGETKKADEAEEAGEAVASARRRARGLTLWAFIALVLSPFSVPTFGAGFILGGLLIVVCVILWRRGLDARRPLAAGIVAVSISVVSAGACGVLFLRPAEVVGGEARRQGRIERRFDRAFDAAADAPEAGAASESDIDGGNPPDVGGSGDDADTLLDADSPDRR